MQRLLGFLSFVVVLAGCAGEGEPRGRGAALEGAVHGSTLRVEGIRMVGEIDGRALDEDGEGRGVFQTSSIILTTLEASNAYGPIAEQTFPETIARIDFPGDLLAPEWAPGSVRRWQTPQIVGETGEILPPPPETVYGTLCIDGNLECLPQIDATTRVVDRQDGSRDLIHDATYGYLNDARAHVVTTWHLVEVPDHETRDGI